ncbi:MULTISPECIES: EAL domain-containing protein [Pseudoalteromonas]|uniref:EAL domain-containing protein n=1 Tax=Pseudoalteromonas amylolytica TaxID=1859457 RepID=A0A1S1MRE2_9GAMM|nr:MULTISPECIES: EAL domain-containing protein [Pseudoalteromonas]OHU86918.1 hypothetical protein BFC16_12685 [Pseudoalteromonas sp. JW3]OHU88372.1 hypothetical protein BET10_20070 [Pseudoalteromonas amylolytica]
MGASKVIQVASLLCLIVFSNISTALPTSTYSDVSNQKTIDDILKDDKSFVALDEKELTASKLVSTWVKVDVSGAQSSEGRKVLYIDKPLNTELELYLVRKNKLLDQVRISSDNFSPARMHSIFPHINFPSPSEDSQVYIKLRSPYKVMFDFQIVSEAEFKRLSQSRLFWYGLELGLLYFIAMALAIMALFSRRQYLALLSIYVCFLAIQCSVNNGSIYFYIPASISQLVSSFNGSWLILACALCLLYHQSYFSISQTNKLLNHVVWGSAATLFFMAILSFGMGSALSVQLQAIASLGTMVVLAAMYSKAKQGFGRDVWLVSAAWLPMFMLGIVWVGMQLGIVTNGHMLGVSKLAVVTHIVLLTLSVFMQDKKQKERFLFYSLHDPDTGLSNRFALNTYLEQLANKNTHHTLLLFRPLIIHSIRLNLGVANANKHLNELFGKLYTELDTYGAATLAVPEGTKTEIFRLDDGTFAITLIGKLSLSQIEQYVCILSSVFEEGIEYKGTRLVDEIEIGVAHSPIHAKTADALIQRAMLALSTKAHDSDRWQIFDVANSVISERRMQLSSALKDAIDNDSFSLYLQPQVNLKTGKVYGAEGLLRWFHPKLGQVPPDEFIPIAESSGLIHLLTEMVFEKGLKYQKQLVEQYPGHVLSLNMSGKDLSKKELLVHLITLVNELNLNPSQIVLEITESVTIDNEDNLKSVLDDYRSVGVKLAIDDFGTGYSSLAYLSRVGFDELKIDKQFVMDIETSSSNQTIAKAMSDMAHSLGLKVVAEGVESIESYARLAHYGCDFGQGYFIAKPMAYEDYLDWLYRVSQSDDVKHYLAR